MMIYIKKKKIISELANKLILLARYNNKIQNIFYIYIYIYIYILSNRTLQFFVKHSWSLTLVEVYKQIKKNKHI
ncbi:MAG: hypothetical protein N7Q72_04365, partial [Spiroplasma sp. Tabriz.8]|nr:hypothetical protein [Spiroplasma sp. Tabriz.8]